MLLPRLLFGAFPALANSWMGMRVRNILGAAFVDGYVVSKQLVARERVKMDS